VVLVRRPAPPGIRPFLEINGQYRVFFFFFFRRVQLEESGVASIACELGISLLADWVLLSRAKSMPFHRGNLLIFPVGNVRCLRSGSPSRRTKDRPNW